jgi:hypothetical protein
MTSQRLALFDVLADIPDFRQSQGCRYALPAVLSLAVAAILCGYKSYSAIAEWGRFYGQCLVQALGFESAKTPCASTLHTILSQLDKAALESRQATWAESLLQQQSEGKPTLEAIASDGKSLRGSKKQGALNVHLLSALSQRLGLPLFQQAVDDRDGLALCQRCDVWRRPLAGQEGKFAASNGGLEEHGDRFDASGGRERNIAKACRRFAAQPWQALALRGIYPKTE